MKYTFPATGRVIAASLILILAALAPAAAKAQPLEIQLKIMDSMDSPIKGAVVRATHQAADGPPAVKSDGRGLARYACSLPENDPGRDIRLKVTAKGYLTRELVLKNRVPPAFLIGKSAAQKPVVIKESVVLKKPGELLGPGLDRRGRDKISRRCLGFYSSLNGALPHLGLEFAWPGFIKKDGTLSIMMDWKGRLGPGMDQVPLGAKAGILGGLPLAVAVGQELLPLPGVEVVRLVMLSETTPGGDPHAMPEEKWITITAPARDYLLLANGKLGPDRFLARNRPGVKSR